MDANVGVTYVIEKLGNLALSVDYTYERLADLELTTRSSMKIISSSRRTKCCDLSDSLCVRAGIR